FPVTEERKAQGLGAFDMASGIEVGYGGCFVGAPPYLFHIKDNNNDDKADSFEIVAHGFGSQDTHETLNTFTWGPDGWLYGLHGVFTISKVLKGAPDPSASEPAIDMDAGVWRYHPRLKKFEMFAEGTSNPWGMDFTPEGECIICCCVIPHLFHIVPGGIYIKQGGKPSYNQYAYGALKEICDHTFHKESGWAHAGLLCLDYPHIPEAFRKSVIFGSIHGCSLKQNVLRSQGSTFVASRGDDFLVSGDKNSRPIQMRWMPDGSILVSDWHDQNPCHQTKPDDWDYERGRLYRIIPPQKPAHNGVNPFHIRKTHQLALEHVPSTQSIALQQANNDDFSKLPLNKRIASYQSALFHRTTDSIWNNLHGSRSESERAWAVRAIADSRYNPDTITKLIEVVQHEQSGRVLREVVSCCIKLSRQGSIAPVLSALYKRIELVDDAIIPYLLWLATEEELVRAPSVFLEALSNMDQENRLLNQHIIHRSIRRIAASGKKEDIELVIHFILQCKHPARITAALEGLAQAVQGKRFHNITSWKLLSNELAKSNDSTFKKYFLQLAAAFSDSSVITESLSTLEQNTSTRDSRQQAMQFLAVLREPKAVPLLLRVLKTDSDTSLRQEAARALASYNESSLGKEMLDGWSEQPALVRLELVNTLRSRKAWAYVMLEALGNKQISRSDLNDNVALAIRQFKDPELNKLLDRHYGSFRDSPAELDALISRLRQELPEKKGDAQAGKLVFAKHCAQCHKFEGEGHDVGPVLDGAERTTEYLLANIVDPNRVVGTPYFTRTVVLKNGKLITGMLVEEDATTLRLKRENAIVEVIVKDEIEEQATSTKSLMPEGLSNNMTVDELRNLIEYLQAPLHTKPSK
ncbi:MAG TPA: c-type cytochrome, partial [Gemmatales bacterium]|nr:c-type cytochrome [Gemmatales bacterium]